MKLMMVCKTCNGLGVQSANYFENMDEVKICTTCNGKAVVDPPQQVLDTIELGSALRMFTDRHYPWVDTGDPEDREKTNQDDLDYLLTVYRLQTKNKDGGDSK